MELNIDAVLVEAGSITTNLTQRCLVLAGQVRALEDKVRAQAMEIERPDF